MSIAHRPESPCDARGHPLHAGAMVTPMGMIGSTSWPGFTVQGWTQ